MIVNTRGVTTRQSWIRMPAKEVQRRAVGSRLQIEAERNKQIQVALEHASEERCVHWFGLWSHPRYRDREDALKRSPLVQEARAYASGDHYTCELLMSMADYLISNPELDQTMYITAEDYRAIS